MGFGQTSNLKLVDKDDLLVKLEELEKSIEKLPIVSEFLSNVNSHELKPDDFYQPVEGYSYEEFDIEGFNAFVETFKTSIEDIKEYINAKDKSDKFISSGVAAIPLEGADVLAEEINDIADDYEDEYDDDFDEDSDFDEDDIFEFDDEIEDEDMTTEQIQEADVSDTPIEENISSIEENSVIDKIVDVSGALVAVSTIGNSGRVWHQVIDGKVVESETPVENFQLTKDLVIKMGDVEKTIPKGTYKVKKVVYNADGSVRSVRVDNGDNELWLYLDSNGDVIKTEYIRNQNGVYTVSSSNNSVIDMYGNKIGQYDAGEYYVYDVLYDSNGNAIAYRLSPDGEYEKWLYSTGNEADGKVALFDQIQANETGTASVSMFEENKGLYGLLGVLFVGLGATLVVRKKMKNKEEATYNNGEDYSNDLVLEDKLSNGNYGVYDVKKNDEGLITEARINPVNSSDEYWVEV